MGNSGCGKGHNSEQGYREANWLPAIYWGEKEAMATVGIIGVTGAVGQIIFQLLQERKFPCDNLRLFASSCSAGLKKQWHGQSIAIETLKETSFEGLDLVISSTPDDIARHYLPFVVQSGAVVIDESAAWRMDPKVPLVIPEVNAAVIKDHQGIIASPNCSTTQLVMTLKPLHEAVGIRRVVVSSYQAVSGAGSAARGELDEQTLSVLRGEMTPSKHFPHQIAFNCIPQIGSVKEGGYTSEEWKMVRETQKILGDENIQISVTCVRVPVQNSHSESVLVETERPVPVAEARSLFENMPGVSVVDNPGESEYPMPVTGNGSDEVFVGRIREDLSSDNGLNYWCVSDNLRKGAATNAVQIAEHLITV